MPRRSPSVIRPAFLRTERWWLTVASVTPTAGARSHVHTSSAASNSDISRTRTGSASAFRRSATSSASSSFTGAAATGAQQMGALVSMIGRAFGMSIMLPTFLTNVKDVGTLCSGYLDERRRPREVIVSRVQLALNVDDIDEAVAFYSKLFGTEPAKRRDGYANFAVASPPLKLVLLENPGQGGTLNHLGVEVESTDVVDAEQTRLAEVGLASVDERGTTCCYAKQDKFWVEGAPSGERWEIYTVLADSATFAEPTEAGGTCCGTE